MKKIFLILFLFFRHFASAQLASDTLTLSEKQQIDSAYRYSCFGQLLLTDSCSKAGDSIAAGEYLLRVDPYYLMSDNVTPANVDSYITHYYVIPQNVRLRYLDTFTKIYQKPQSLAYETFRRMLAEDQAIRNQLDLSKDSLAISVSCDQMLLTDSVHFAYLLKYVHRYGWPSIANGSIYASVIALHDHRHHKLYKNIILKEVLKGNVDRDILFLTVYWLRHSQSVSILLSKYKYVAFDVTSILKYEMPDCLSEVQKVVAAHCPITTLWLITYGEKVSEKKGHLEFLMGYYGKVMSNMLIELSGYNCNLSKGRKYEIEHGIWTATQLFTNNDSSKMQLFILYGDEIKYSDLDILFADSSFATHAVYFDNNKAAIKAESYVFLNELAQWLRSKPAVKIEISGHTDNVGGAAANLKLSRARADEVKKYLVSEGIDVFRMTTKGYGATKPMEDNNTEEYKYHNRRVEFRRL